MTTIPRKRPATEREQEFTQRKIATLTSGFSDPVQLKMDENKAMLRGFPGNMASETRLQEKINATQEGIGMALKDLLALITRLQAVQNAMDRKKKAQKLAEFDSSAYDSNIEFWKTQKKVAKAQKVIAAATEGSAERDQSASVDLGGDYEDEQDRMQDMVEGAADGDLAALAGLRARAAEGGYESVDAMSEEEYDEKHPDPVPISTRQQPPANQPAPQASVPVAQPAPQVSVPQPVPQASVPQPVPQASVPQPVPQAAGSWRTFVPQPVPPRTRIIPLAPESVQPPEPEVQRPGGGLFSSLFGRGMSADETKLQQNKAIARIAYHKRKLEPRMPLTIREKQALACMQSFPEWLKDQTTAAESHKIMMSIVGWKTRNGIP